MNLLTDDITDLCVKLDLDHRFRLAMIDGRMAAMFAMLLFALFIS